MRRDTVLARSALAFVACLAALTLTLNGSPLGANAGPLQASGSPSPSGGPTTAAVKFLNPSTAYNPHLFPEDGEGVIIEDPKISDKFDGVDRAYHVVVAVAKPPSNLVVEASIRYEGENDVTIGEMSPVAGNPNVYELFWDIPESLPTGAATMFVRLFQQSATGFEEVANDSVPVDVQHVAGPPGEAEETAELTWPIQNGEIGFYKPRGGTWRTLVEGFASASTVRYLLVYSTTPLGQTPVYKSCSGQLTPGAAVESRKAFSGQCTLAGQDLPSAVTAVGVIAADIDILHSGPLAALSMDAADVHVVRGYAQTPEQMKITLIPVPSGPVSNADGLTSDRARAIADRCLVYLADVKDQLDRPVIGANIDVHIVGPNDQLMFGDDTVDSGGAPGSYKAPDKGGHSNENGAECSNQPDGDFAGTHGDHNVPGGDDIKHRESLGGTGVGGAAGPGQWKFYIYSQTPGFTDITAWVDDESVADPKEQRPVDSDTLDPGEPVTTARAQWYSEAPKLEFVPLGDTAPANSCNEFLIKARAGTAAIPGINVDVHAKGPDDGLEFCDPGAGTPRRAPDMGDHDAEDAGESTAKEPSPKTQHTEGETNDEGNFVVGVLSPTVGDTTLSAWLDGEVGFDNDLQAAATAEPAASARMSWASATGDAKVTFLNPSAYGTNRISKKVDADALYHIVVRVDAPSLVPGIELQLGTGTGASFVKSKDLGTAVNVTGTGTYELAWDVGVTDGNYTLRAVIPGTSVVADHAVVVNNATSMDPSDVPDEALELTRPLNDQQAAFSRQVTPVEGIASSGTEGVDVFYTKLAANVALTSADWIKCGFLQLSGEGATPQPFKTTCTLEGADQASQVTAIAAAPFDCQEPLPGSGCDAGPDALPEIGRNPGRLEAGDAHRIFGFEASPLISVSPPENEASPGACAKYVVQVTDQTGQVLAGQNVDAHVAGPGDGTHFCNPGDGSATARRAPDQGGHSVVDGHGDQGAHVSDQSDTQHAEAEATAAGRFIFGITSPVAGDSQIVVWVDRTDNDFQDTDEAVDTSVLHWASGGGNTGGGCTEIGTMGADVLTGTSGADKICGRGGNDVLKGKPGDDVLLGGKGNDRIIGGGGNDRINASRGKDKLKGKGGNDNLKGAAGRDRLNGGPGADTCAGGPARDRVRKCESGSRAPSPRLARGGVA